MNSSQFPKLVIIALIFSAISFLVANSLTLTPVMVAILVLIGSLVTGFVCAGSQPTDTSNVEIKTLYVGNLPYRANESAIRELFAKYGYVQSVRLMKDKNTGKRRGFGFVEMAAADANDAINKLNDQEFQQRTLKVREAKERPDNNDDE